MLERYGLAVNDARTCSSTRELETPAQLCDAGSMIAPRLTKTPRTTALLLALLVSGLVSTACKTDHSDLCLRGKTTVSRIAIHEMQAPDPSGWITATAVDGGDLLISPEVAARCRKRGKLAPGRVILLRTTQRGACPAAEEVVGCAPR